MLERFTWYRQAAFRWQDGERTIYIDPWGTPEDAPQGDLILITHAHDHFSPTKSRGSHPATRLVAPHDVAAELSGNVTASPPGSPRVAGISFRTVPG